METVFVSETQEIEDAIRADCLLLENGEQEWELPPGKIVVCVCTKSAATLCGKGWELNLEPGDICLPTAGQAFRAKGRGARLVLLETEPGFLDREYAEALEKAPVLREAVAAACQGTQTKPARFRLGEQEKIRLTLEDMLCEYRGRQKGYAISLKSGLSRILVMLIRLAEGAEAKEQRPEEAAVTQEILRYLYENMEKASLKDTAARFYYHPNTINRLLLRRTGRNFSETVRELRLERVRGLLVETNLPVRQIAESCGYRNMTHFYHIFYESCGMTPLAYRSRGDDSCVEP